MKGERKEHEREKIADMKKLNKKKSKFFLEKKKRQRGERNDESVQ